MKGGGEYNRASGLESWHLKTCEHTQGWVPYCWPGCRRASTSLLQPPQDSTQLMASSIEEGGERLILPFEAGH